MEQKLNLTINASIILPKEALIAELRSIADAIEECDEESLKDGLSIPVDSDLQGQSCYVCLDQEGDD